MIKGVSPGSRQAGGLTLFGLSGRLAGSFRIVLFVPLSWLDLCVFVISVPGLSFVMGSRPSLSAVGALSSFSVSAFRSCKVASGSSWEMWQFLCAARVLPSGCGEGIGRIAVTSVLRVIPRVGPPSFLLWCVVFLVCKYCLQSDYGTGCHVLLLGFHHFSTFRPILSGR